MASATFMCYMGNTNKDLKVGASITEYFSLSGAGIPAGSTITSASLYVSSLRVYTQKGLYLTLGA